MRNDIIQYPKLYTGKHLPKRLSGSSDNCILNDSVTYRFNDYMTYYRQSPIIRNIVSLSDTNEASSMIMRTFYDSTRHDFQCHNNKFF